MRLTANAALRYASRDLKAGEEFEASESDAFVLKTTGKAMDAARPGAPARAAEAAVAGASSGAGLFSSDQAGHRGGRHKRRDMRAED